ncbi:hypothetical protein SPRG_07516 [Saprolegnia parasitica CBS 223.65]|uniref:Endonuclease V n=1 Tax=Saprolegnia parasitica (strain CBS 223.65) TaxID=695850 RepID=A0A067CKF9_SAPPC|nr:hypothetical protein SPRG_07516 [Saprolegnia parasitica CBS 223.65]KDO27267.1 hypothetical protein SPRG_07516 [Saprolegnia parasitica CBS 223.65]|eukprot:XP_012202043.1 hypothetical protein SPRG_07516 [Saprolegnia parasitica CBS 223.65]
MSMEDTDAQRVAWEAEQTEMKCAMNMTSSVDESRLARIGGVDISFLKGTNDACATLVVLSYPDLKVLCEASCYTNLTLPYIPTFLGFRELPALLPLFDMIPEDLQPQLVFVDGNGRLHPRGFGIASHLGVVKALPTIGVAKTFLNVDGLAKSHIRALVEDAKAIQRGDASKDDVIVPLRGESGTVWGSALCTKGIQNPIYVSIGNLITLEQAVALTQVTSLFRVPEPIRQADLRSRAIIRAWEADGVDTGFRVYTGP